MHANLGLLAIYSLGEGLTYNLVKPILERCSTEQLCRLEEDSPVSLSHFRNARN
jgi:hypothetical protein